MENENLFEINRKSKDGGKLEIEFKWDPYWALTETESSTKKTNQLKIWKVIINELRIKIDNHTKIKDIKSQFKKLNQNEKTTFNECSTKLTELNVGDVCLYKTDGKIYAKLVVLVDGNKEFRDYKTGDNPSKIIIIENEQSIPIPRDVLQDLVNNNFKDLNLNLNQGEITPEIIPSIDLFMDQDNEKKLFKFLGNNEHSYELCNRSNVTQTNNYCNPDTLSKENEICCEKELLEKFLKKEINFTEYKHKSRFFISNMENNPTSVYEICKYKYNFISKDFLKRNVKDFIKMLSY